MQFQFKPIVSDRVAEVLSAMRDTTTLDTDDATPVLDFMDAHGISYRVDEGMLHVDTRDAVVFVSPVIMDNLPYWAPAGDTFLHFACFDRQRRLWWPATVRSGDSVLYNDETLSVTLEEVGWVRGSGSLESARDLGEFVRTPPLESPRRASRFRMETQEGPEGILLERVIDAFCSLLDAAVPDAFCALPRVLSLFRDSVFVDRLEAYATDVTADEEPEPGQRDAVIFGIVWGLDAVKFHDAIAGWICDYMLHWRTWRMHDADSNLFLSRILHAGLRHRIVCVGKDWYNFDGVGWAPLSSFREITTEFSGDILARIVGTDAFRVKSEEHQKSIEGETRRLIKLFDTARTERIRQVFDTARKSFLTRRDFDAIPWAVPFENGIFDLRRGCLVKPDPNARVLIRIPDELAPRKDYLDEIAELEAKVAQMFPEVTLREYVLNLFALNLWRCGHKYQMLIQHIGPSGQNGKSFWFTMLEKAFKGLVTKIKSGVYNQPTEADTTRGDPFLNHMRGRAILYTSELQGSLNSERLKTMCGSEPLPNRLLHSNEVRDVTITGWQHLMSNNRIPAQYSDRGVARRLRVCIPWTSRFIDDPTEVDPANHVYAADHEFMQRFTGDLLQAFRWWMLERAVKIGPQWNPDTNRPPAVRKLADEMAKENDPVADFVTHSLVKVKDAKTSFKDIASAFTCYPPEKRSRHDREYWLKEALANKRLRIMDQMVLDVIIR